MAIWSPILWIFVRVETIRNVIMLINPGWTHPHCTLVADGCDKESKSTLNAITFHDLYSVTWQIVKLLISNKNLESAFNYLPNYLRTSMRNLIIFHLNWIKSEAPHFTLIPQFPPVRPLPNQHTAWMINLPLPERSFHSRRDALADWTIRTNWDLESARLDMMIDPGGLAE